MIRSRFLLLALVLSLCPITAVEAAYGLVAPGSASRGGKVAQHRPLTRARSGWKQQVGALTPYQTRTTSLVATKTGRLVSYPPNRVTIDSLLARRALNPKRFDFYHPQLGRFLARAQNYREIGPICGNEPLGIISDTPYHRYLLWRRSLNPDRFDFYHPLLGVILQEHKRIIDKGRVCPPRPPVPPKPPGPPKPPKPPGPGGGTVSPQQVVPEPSSVVLLALGMGAALIFGVQRRGRLTSGPTS